MCAGSKYLFIRIDSLYHSSDIAGIDISYDNKRNDNISKIFSYQLRINFVSFTYLGRNISLLTLLILAATMMLVFIVYSTSFYYDNKIQGTTTRLEQYQPR